MLLLHMFQICFAALNSKVTATAHTTHFGALLVCLVELTSAAPVLCWARVVLHILQLLLMWLLVWLLARAQHS